MKKFVYLVLGLGAFSVASFAGTVSTQCTFTGFTPNTTATFVNASAGSPQSASCTGATALGVDGSTNILTEVQVYIESDYQNCGNFANPCTAADVRLTYTPSTGTSTWTATSGALNGQSPYEDVTGGISSSSYIVNGTGASPGASNGFVIAAQDLSNLAGFYSTWSESVASQLVSVSPSGQAPVTSSAQVAIVYTYTTVTTGTPEPVSMFLFGSGLLAVSLIGRKKFARK